MGYDSTNIAAAFETTIVLSSVDHDRPDGIGTIGARPPFDRSVIEHESRPLSIS
jgi:hypothetical protein